MHTVTVELDSGPYEATFGYVPIGEPAYSDVPSEGPIQPTENDAERYGFLLLAIGNWRSFRVEKRYLGTPVVPEQIDGSDDTPPVTL